MRPTDSVSQVVRDAPSALHFCNALALITTWL
jgi:hypothetical protein